MTAGILAGLLGCLALAGSRMMAQQQEAQPSDQKQTIAFPTGDAATSVLTIETSPPAKVRVGQQYQYPIQVRNTTKGLVLENLRIEAHPTDGAKILRFESKPEPKKPEAQRHETTWSIPRLMPGETATAQVTAVGDREGAAKTLFSVKYDTAVTLTTTFVQPRLAVTKSAPEQVDLCDQIKFHYRVHNTGSGDAKGITLTDQLPDGMFTTDGKPQITIPVKDLAPDQSQEFDIPVISTKSGKLSSHALARTGDGVSAQSNDTTTKVMSADLSVQAQGPNVTVVGQNVAYQIVVKNQGDAVAKDTQLTVNVPDGFDIVASSDQDKQVKEKEAGKNKHSRVFHLGDLQPGQQQQVWLRTMGRQAGKGLSYDFSATSACDRHRKDRQPQRTMVRTDVLAISSLKLTAVDEHDPIKTGDTVAYRISVENQGSATANNVRVVATLPSQLAFQQADGASRAQFSDNKVTFDPIPQLAPNEKAEWRITAKADQPAEIRLQVEVTSDQLSQPALVMEPTTLYGPQIATKPEETKIK